MSYTIAVTTPRTIWWDPAHLDNPCVGIRLSALCAISGDLEEYIYATRKADLDRAVPSMGQIYDILPEAMLKVTRINIKLEVIFAPTIQTFLNALACFFNHNTPRCEQLHLETDQGYGADDEIWYPLMKMPSNIKIFITGTFHSPDTEPYIRTRILKNDHVHPARPLNGTFNMITESRRVLAKVRPLADELFAAIEDGTLPEERAVKRGLLLAQHVLPNIHRRIERGQTYSAEITWFDVYQEHELQVDLGLADEWADAILAGTPPSRVEEHKWGMKFHDMRHKPIRKAVNDWIWADN